MALASIGIVDVADGDHLGVRLGPEDLQMVEAAAPDADHGHPHSFARRRPARGRGGASPAAAPRNARRRSIVESLACDSRTWFYTILSSPIGRAQDARDGLLEKDHDRRWVIANGDGSPTIRHDRVARPAVPMGTTHLRVENAMVRLVRRPIPGIALVWLDRPGLRGGPPRAGTGAHGFESHGRVRRRGREGR